jgi:hypothetical protein
LTQIGPVIHAANFSASAFTTATDIFEFTPVVDRAVYIYGMTLGQTTDLSDAAEEVLMIGLYRDVTAGSTGTAATEYVYSNFSASASPTLAVVSNRGTASTGGTLIDIIPWNIRIPLMWFPLPELRPKFSNIAAEGPVSSFRLIAAPTDSLTVSGTLYWTSI